MQFRPGPHKKCESSCAKIRCIKRKAIGLPCIISNQAVVSGQPCSKMASQLLQMPVARRAGCLPVGLSSRIQFTQPQIINSFGRYAGSSGSITNPQKGGLVINNF